MSEEKLIIRAKDGDEAAWAELYTKHFTNVNQQLLWYTHNQDKADDLTQEVFLLAFRKLHSFRMDARFSTWLYRIASNVFYMSKRGVKKQIISLDDCGEGKHLHDTLCKDDERQKNTIDRIALIKVISELPDGQRNILLLQFADGYTHKEIADKLGITTGASKSQSHHAKTRLKNLLNRIPESETEDESSDSRSEE